MSNAAVAALVVVPSQAEAAAGADTFDDWYREFYAPVASRIGRFVDCPHDVDDLTQHTFTDLFVRWPGLTGEDERTAQMWLIAHNKTVDYLRRRTRWAQRNLPLAAAPDQPCTAPGPATVTAARDSDRLVRVAVAKTKPAYQALLHARYVAELPYAELEVDFGKSEVALRQLGKRAHEMVRRELDALGVRALAPIVALRAKFERVALPPWAISAGQVAFVSVLATSIVMSPTGSVPAAADAPSSTSPAASHARRRALSGPVLPRMAAPGEPARPAGKPELATAPAVNERSPVVALHPPKLPVPTPTMRPCVGSCPDGATITVTVPLVENGSVSQEQNIIRCSAIPPGQPVVTCREDEGANYAVSPSPVPGAG